jgi:hypothetical protein
MKVSGRFSRRKSGVAADLTVRSGEYSALLRSLLNTQEVRGEEDSQLTAT